MLRGDPQLDRELRAERKKRPLGPRDYLVILAAIVVLVVVVLIVMNAGSTPST